MKQTFRNQLGVNIIKTLVEHCDPEYINPENYVDKAFHIADLVVAKIEAYDACPSDACRKDEKTDEEERPHLNIDEIVELIAAVTRAGK